MASTAPEESSDAPREHLAAALSLWLTPEQIHQLIDEVLAIQKRVSVEVVCKKCGQKQRQYGSVSDAKAVALALPDLLNQAFGRPGEATGDNQQVIFNRWTKMGGAEVAEIG